MNTRTRRNGRALTSCLRVALAEGSGKSGTLSRSFLRELHRVDSGIELHWIPSINRWVLYRLVRRGVIPSEDQMLKEVEVRGPRGEFRSPGQWLIDLLRSYDKTRNGSVCQEYANRKFLRKIDNEQKVMDERQAKLDDDRLDSFAHNIENHVVYSRKSATMPIGTTKIMRNKNV